MFSARTMLGLTFLIALPAAVLAQEDKKEANIKFMDANGDELISRTEWSKFAQTFTKLDGDKDNSLSATELEATGASAELLMKLADLNSDNKVPRTEWAKLIQAFARLDANKDNSLDLPELQKAADAAVASASGSASLGGSGKSTARPTGPTLWRGNIEGRSEIELVVNGTQVTGREIRGGGGGGGGGQSLGAGTIVMTGNGTTGNMDATYTEGPQRGETCLGIYRLEGDRLQWCVNNRGGRPQGFTGGGGNWVLTLTRVPN